MTLEEAITYYFDRKNAKDDKDRLSRDEIKVALSNEHSFSGEEIKLILREISNRELAALEQEQGQLMKLMNSIYLSYFFIFFGIFAFVSSIFILQFEAKNSLTEMLPYVIILGSLFIIGKHANRIIAHYKSKK